jgi:lipopolysaccharide/colanic/teichoic acid biosynthesis glycosyltransferase
VVQGRTEWVIGRFSIYKFRTMARQADDSLHRAYITAFVHGRAAAGAGRSPYKLAHDARITRVGRWLRRTSLDELPQLINVLRGEMSVVGPRPVPDYEVAEYPDAGCLHRLATLPGITGLWQVTARSQVGFAEMIRLDCDYVRRQSLRLDLKIMLMTPGAILSGKGAG